jgi:hypothetical protein
MGVYLYCLGPTELPDPEDVTGVDGASVRAEEVEGFRAWLSDTDAPPTASVARVREHNAVVEAAAREVTPVPIRFGQWFGSRGELEASLGSRRDGLRAALARVRGAVEFGVRVVDPAVERSVDSDRSSGRAYLEALARREREAELARARGREIAVEMESSLGSSIREQRSRPGGRHDLVAISHLVDRHDTGTYRRRLEELPPRYGDLHFVVTGPWPPYGFVDDAS